MSFHIDLNVTSICNLACTYCSEGVECGLSSLYLKNTEVKVQDLVTKLADRPGDKQINFWGGEPFINWNYCKAIMDGFKDREDIVFFFYTNGVLIPDLINEVIEYRDKVNGRMIIQISYDGKWLTDNIRVDKSGKGTADKVISAYELLTKNNFQVSLKSVISSEGFPHLYDSFLDLYKIQGFYNPTPDLYSELSFDEFQESLEILGKELEKIMAFIVKNNLNPEVFSWFGTSKAICNVGNGIVGVDLTGDVYPCHGCFYDNTNEFKIGTLDDFENGKLDKVRKKFEKLNKELPMDCMSCSVNFCMKCQAANLAKSNKDTFEEKWNDYQGNWQVCQTFKFNDKYNKSLRYMLQNKG